VIRQSTVEGTVTAPPSKSFTHRAMILGALTRSEFVLKNPLVSEDTKATLDALHSLGTDIFLSSGRLTIHCEELKSVEPLIDSRNSGTTMRLMAGVASLLPEETTFTGDESLRRRPMAGLMDALGQLGARHTYVGREGYPPLKVSGPITGSSARVAGGTSSQFVSSLLIACTQKQGDTDISVDGVVTSRPYVDITLRMLDEFGAEVLEEDGAFRVPGAQLLGRGSYTVPGDYSSAAFMLVAAAITGGRVTVRNLDRRSPQGDREIVGLLRAFGANVTVGDQSVTVDGGRLAGTDVDVRDTPDLFPILAVLAAVADGRTRISGGANLRQKESDRIATTTEFLSRMGATIKATEDGCEVVGGEKLHGTTVSTEGDHRILMAASVAALVSASETVIDDDESFKVSYPWFIRDVHQLGGRAEVRK
jgi:3-phosphoshikimate 1-carboxyvinyltransferase